MKQSVRITAITGSVPEIQELLFWPCSGKFAELCAKVIVQQDYLLEMPVLYALCSWVMQLAVTPGNKQLTKEFILEEFFSPGHNLQLFSNLLNDAYWRDGRDKDESQYPGWFKRYRNFSDKVAGLLAQRQLEFHTFTRLVSFYLLEKRPKNRIKCKEILY